MIENRLNSSMVNNWIGRLLEEKSGLSAAPEIIHLGAEVGVVIETHNRLSRAMEHARVGITEKALAGQSYQSGTAIFADRLSQSKGRFTRQWHAPLGGIWGCLVLANTMSPLTSRFIPFAVGLACCETLRQLGFDEAYLRWVNDVLIDEKKIAGFLVESYTEPLRRQGFILVGFGINVNNEKFPTELAASANSIRTILGYSLNVAEISAQFLARFRWYLGVLYYEEKKHLEGRAFTGRQGQHLLLESWLEHSNTIDKKVWYGFDVVNSPQYKARVKAVDSDGGLVMQLENGSEKTEYSGEIRYIG